MTEYKGYKILPIEWQYGDEKFTDYEIHKIDGNKEIIFYKDNGVIPITATLEDSQWSSIEEAKQAIDNGTLIRGGMFATDKNGYVHWASFKAIGKIWHCDHCDKDYFDDKVKPYAETEEYGLVCKHCFNKLISKGRKLHFLLSPDDYDYKIKE